jgi:hypothetical protein
MKPVSTMIITTQTQTGSEDQNLGKMSLSANVVATIDPQENSKQSYIVNDEIGNVVFVL